MIDGKLFRDALISGANNVAKERKLVDSLNVFPVPDGDTGTNMSMTIGAAKRELELLSDDSTVGEVSKKAAAALLRGARGNSGVILSLLFRGMSKGFTDSEEITSKNLVEALNNGVDSAYKAVMKPTEGTILTVARVGAERAEKEYKDNPSIEVLKLWNIMVDASKEALENTPELLPVLKKAGVVDAGGKGLVVIYDGMSSVFNGNGIIPDSESVSMEDHDDHELRDAAAEFNGEITFTYCTEFIILKEPKANALSLRAYLESIGDSVVVVEDEEIIKSHLHTDDPGKAMQKALENGQLTNIKIDNMREQHKGKKKAAAASRRSTEKQKFPYAAVNKEQKFGFVAIAAGDGIQELFKDLAVDNIVSGGQTMNPSTDDILEAIHATPAQNVIVLPNNKNIIMAAEQAEKIADRKVYVLPTKSIPEGIAAMLAFDPELSLAENQIKMVKAIDEVGTGLITFAARDSNMDGHKITKGEVLALENGRLAFSEKNGDKGLESSVVRLVRSLIKKHSSFVTLMHGEEVSEEQAERIENAVREKMPDNIEVVTINGGQPVYYYIVSVE